MYLLFYYLINLLASTVTMQALNSVKKKDINKHLHKREVTHILQKK